MDRPADAREGGRRAVVAAAAGAPTTIAAPASPSAWRRSGATAAAREQRTGPRGRTPTRRHGLGGVRAFARALLPVALALLPTGCALFRDDPPPCPRAAILRGADTVTAYRPGASARSAADIRYLGALADVVSACRYEDGAVEVDIALALVAERGPAYGAAGGGPADLTYFVAVIGPGGDLVGRETFAAPIAIPEGAERAGVAEELTQTIPGVEPAAAAAYRILVGFRLSEEEVRRRRRGGEHPSGAAVAPPPPASSEPEPEFFTD